MDEDNSGSVSHEEFMQALKDFDFIVPPNIERVASPFLIMMATAR